MSFMRWLRSLPAPVSFGLGLVFAGFGVITRQSIWLRLIGVAMVLSGLVAIAVYLARRYSPRFQDHMLAHVYDRVARERRRLFGVVVATVGITLLVGIIGAAVHNQRRIDELRSYGETVTATVVSVEGRTRGGSSDIVRMQFSTRDGTTTATLYTDDTTAYGAQVGASFPIVYDRRDPSVIGLAEQMHWQPGHGLIPSMVATAGVTLIGCLLIAWPAARRNPQTEAVPPS
jgi:hypothetical protein